MEIERYKLGLIELIKGNRSKIFLALLVTVSATVIYFRLIIQLQRGPGWDTFAFLLNGLEFAGKGKNYFEIYRPPLLSALCAIFFRFGFDHEFVIFLIDSFLTMLGIIGAYYLFRLRFSPSISFLGGLLFLSFPDMMENLTQGITDIISISLSVWTIYFVIRAVEDDSRYFQIAVPLWILTFMARFTGGLMILPVLFYIVIRPKAEKYLLNIFRGSLWSLLILVPYFVYYWFRLGSPLIQLGEPFKAVGATTRLGMLSDPIEPSTYFATHFLDFLSVLPSKYLFLALVILGLIGYAGHLFKLRKQKLSLFGFFFLLLTGLLLSLLFFVKIMNFMIVNILWFIYLGIVFPMFFDFDRKAAIGLVFLFWFVIFFNTHSHMLVKVTRYYITMIPSIIFFIIYSLDWVKTLLPEKKISAQFAFTLLVGASVIMVGVSIYFSYQWLKAMKDWRIPGVQMAAEWFNRFEKKENLKIVGDYFVAWRWYLRREVIPMPPLKGGSRAFNHELEKMNADYYFTISDPGPLNSYKLLKDFKTARVYKKSASRPPGSQDVFLIGRDVDHYIDDILGFKKYYVTKENSPYPDAYSDVSYTYIDEYSLDKLKSYDAVLLYNFRWHDLRKAEELLKQYVSEGRSVIIDGSRNMVGLKYNLDNAVLFDIIIKRKSTPKNSKVNINDGFLANKVDTHNFSPFLTETGEAWFGTTYEDVNKQFRVLATLNDDVLVAVQRVGKGKIIWVGFNLFFHSFYYRNKDEKQLVKNIFALISMNKASIGSRLEEESDGKSL